jgi:hypothetical protein
MGKLHKACGPLGRSFESFATKAHRELVYNRLLAARSMHNLDTSMELAASPQLVRRQKNQWRISWQTPKPSMRA